MRINNVATEVAQFDGGGLVHDGPALLFGFLIGTDAVNDPTITVYDNTAASGKEVVPTNTYDASALGLNGFMPGAGIKCKNGIYVANDQGTSEVTVFYTPHFDNS